jgi:hypothetical protein
MKNNYQSQIVALWTAFLLGLLFHTQLALMPLFHGLEIAHSHGESSTSWIFWLMLVFFVLPMLAIVVTPLTSAITYRVVHFRVTLIYTVLNFLHVVMDLFITPIVWYQIALMVLLLGIGLMLNLISYRWVRHSRHEKVAF